jgi:hypothetical protein
VASAPFGALGKDVSFLRNPILSSDETVKLTGALSILRATLQLAHVWQGRPIDYATANWLHVVLLACKQSVTAASFDRLTSIQRDAFSKIKMLIGLESHANFPSHVRRGIPFKLGRGVNPRYKVCKVSINCH